MGKTIEEIEKIENEVFGELDNFIEELSLRTELKKRGIDVGLKHLNLTKEQEIKVLKELLKQAKKEGFLMC